MNYPKRPTGERNARGSSRLRGLTRWSQLSVALLLSGCATAVITPEVEEELGARMSQEVEQQIGLYHDTALKTYVDAVGRRLLAVQEPGPYTYRFDIVDQAEPNAFASPGGYIYISRGLLAQVNDEAELAGILAHEISHVSRRHHAKQVGRQMGAGLLTLPGKAVGVISEDVGNMINAPIEMAGDVLLASYSRDQESEADAYGMKLVAAAGYDPAQLAAALAGIERSVDIQTGAQHEASFFDSHPTTPTRVEDINRQAGTIDWQARTPIADQQSLYRRLDGLWWGAQNPQQGIFRGQQFMSSDLGLSIRFPDGWKTINTPMFVGAAQADGRAYLAMGSGERVADPNILAELLAEKMQREAGISPAERRTLSLGEWPASIVRYDDISQDETVSLYYLFVTTPRETLTLMAMGLERYRDELRQTALSLGPLTPEEYQSIGGLRLRIAQKRPGETLSSFNARVGNRWPADLTAAINGADEEQVTESARLIKYVRPEQYRP